ncbi:MAG: hypothetical protein ACO312_06420 [Candidatus Nanopelagicaceae bacterium]
MKDFWSPKKWKVLALLISVILVHLDSVSAAEATEWDDLNPVLTSQKAFNSVNDFIDAQPLSSVSPRLIISPNAEKRNYEVILTGVSRVSTLWSSLVNPGELKVVLFTELDGEWIDKQQNELLGEWASSAELQSKRLEKYGCNIGGMYLPGVLFFCVKEEFNQSDDLWMYGERHKFAHEYTHFMEMNVKNWPAIAKNQGVGRRNTCWIEEGFATFYGFAVGSYPMDKDGANRRTFLKQLTHAYDRNRNRRPGALAESLQVPDTEEFRELMNMLENTPFPCDETELAYALGSMAAEVLVSVKGQAAMNSFYSNSSKTGDWKMSFEKVFGISVPSFYEKLSNYVASQFKDENFPIKGYVQSQAPTPDPIATPVESSIPQPSTTPTANQSALPIPTPTAGTPVATLRMKTITCYKGKKERKVRGLKPKCPKGYKKK